jgi:hypothetical protein
MNTNFKEIFTHNTCQIFFLMEITICQEVIMTVGERHSFRMLKITLSRANWNVTSNENYNGTERGLNQDVGD